MLRAMRSPLPRRILTNSCQPKTDNNCTSRAMYLPSSGLIVGDGLLVGTQRRLDGGLEGMLEKGLEIEECGSEGDNKEDGSRGD